jgi:hypothetical protein
MRVHRRTTRITRPSRAGAATLDYVLILGAILPLAGLTLYQSGRVIRAVYQFTCALICWPFM